MASCRHDDVGAPGSTSEAPGTPNPTFGCDAEVDLRRRQTRRVAASRLDSSP